ncbi:MAG: polysaccharide export protein [Rhodospirillales bacterium]|nr:polysaccharide export protein [Rhodospirillales bacterium]
MRRISALVIALLLAACTPGAGLPPLPPATSTAYRLGPNDQIRVITFGEDALSEIFRVNDGGMVALPLLGLVRAEGRTPDELATHIADLLREKRLLRAPSVAVEVTEYRPIFILGEVAKPGQYAYQPGMTVLSAAAVAGGFTYRAAERNFAVMRRIDGHPVQRRAGPETLLRPGDIITVLERYF